jgi:hypothetical protein
LEELIENINWPILSLNAIIKMVSKPQGLLKKFQLIRLRIFEEIQRRQLGHILPKSKEMPLRYCQIKAKQGYNHEELHLDKPVFSQNRSDDLIMQA